jgi:hypothetical protein
MALGISIKCHSCQYFYAECRVLFIVMLNVIILSVIMLNVLMLSAVAPSIAYDNSKSVLFH